MQLKFRTMLCFFNIARCNPVIFFINQFLKCFITFLLIGQFGVTTAHPNDAFCVGIKSQFDMHILNHFVPSQCFLLLLFYPDAERVIWISSCNSELAYWGCCLLAYFFSSYLFFILFF